MAQSAGSNTVVLRTLSSTLLYLGALCIDTPYCYTDTPN